MGDKVTLTKQGDLIKWRVHSRTITYPVHGLLLPRARFIKMHTPKPVQLSLDFEDIKPIAAQIPQQSELNL